MSIITAMPGTLASGYQPDGEHRIKNGIECANCRRTITGFKTYSSASKREYNKDVSFIEGESICELCGLPVRRRII